ncbi:uncharacterized protein BO66DRAFT_399162 [Aspergillus aculeatinus CBS 121060]|uniref:Uncharacterized protein n=1 Tax=Aspergillus aculeatinus CBS 121060 TaxID=1448322 RepID=A0ACD1HGI3_9EURO|nr:hypothetical protein BO66DRAFT_399162 [Aspergillus aculeatinus CBS 121060]RAH72954.1 hypothetical protein BO66DRAFT_399162 [Aspergillus aculeatinus CBS 121060]
MSGHMTTATRLSLTDLCSVEYVYAMGQVGTKLYKIVDELGVNWTTKRAYTEIPESDTEEKVRNQRACDWRSECLDWEDTLLIKANILTQTEKDELDTVVLNHKNHDYSAWTAVLSTMGGLHNYRNSENVRKSNKWYVYPGLYYWKARIEKLDQSLVNLSKEVDQDEKYLAEEASKEEEARKLAACGLTLMSRASLILFQAFTPTEQHGGCRTIPHLSSCDIPSSRGLVDFASVCSLLSALASLHETPETQENQMQGELFMKTLEELHKVSKKNVGFFKDSVKDSTSLYLAYDGRYPLHSGVVKFRERVEKAEVVACWRVSTEGMMRNTEFNADLNAIAMARAFRECIRLIEWLGGACAECLLSGNRWGGCSLANTLERRFDPTDLSGASHADDLNVVNLLSNSESEIPELVVPEVEILALVTC